MNRIAITSFLTIAMGLACASEAGVISSITRFDEGDITPKNSEQLVSNGLQRGALIWNDSSFTYGPPPSYLSGADYIQMVDGDRADTDYQLSIALSQPAIVYLIIDDRIGNLASTMPWIASMGFTDTGNNLLVADNVSSIYSGLFSSQLVVRQQNSGVNTHMYTVAATVQPSGDVTLTQSTTTDTAVINSLTFQATNGNVNLQQVAGTTLTINSGAITKN